MKKLLIILALITVIFIAGCVQPENPEGSAESKVVSTPTPVQITERTDIRETAEKIRNGEIYVGDDYTLTFYGRFHTIHNKVLGLDCYTCHVSSKYADDFLYQRKYKAPASGSPGVVDRGVCLGCHKAGGPAFELYGTADE